MTDAQGPWKPFLSRQAGRLLTARAVLMMALAHLGLSSDVAQAADESRLSVFHHGTPVDYLPCGASPVRFRAAALMGGGVDVQAAFRWMIAKMAECADGTSGRAGNFLVVRARGDAAYDSFIFKLGTVASVSTLIVPSIESANDLALDPYVQNAGAIFISGGDQGDYYNFWKGTRLERLISEQVARYGVPVGGTSAGMMILSQFNYIAFPFSIDSSQALSDPFTEGAVTLKNDFWTNATPFLPLGQTVTDSHLDARDRMGRLVTFLARIIDSGWASPSEASAIGVDEQTALLMEFPTNGNWGLFGVFMRTVANPGVNGAAYILGGTASSTLIVAPERPLTFTDVAVQKLQADGGTSEYRLNVVGGTLTSSTGSIY